MEIGKKDSPANCVGHTTHIRWMEIRLKEMLSVSYITYVDIRAQVSLIRLSIFLFLDVPNLKLRVIAFACNTKRFAIVILFFSHFSSFSSMLLDRLAKVICKDLFDCCFERVWPGSDLIIWYAVCCQPMSFRNKQ